MKTASADVQRLEFFLVNCANLFKTSWEIDDHRFEIAPTTAEFHPIARLSHTGALTRRDGKSFDAGSCDDLLDTIGWSLSFATGRIVFPTLIRGFDNEGQLIYLNYSPTRYELARKPKLPTWLPSTTRDQHGLLVEVITGMHAKLADPVWNETLRLAVDCYGDAVGHGLSEASRLILIQAGLEKLVMTWQAIRRVMPNGKAFPRNQFGLRLSLMLTEYGINASIPSELTDLNALRDVNHTDAPRVVAFVRNKYTHEMESMITTAHETQARQLSQRYLELVILKILGVTKPILNTLHRAGTPEQPEKLPWMP